MSKRIALNFIAFESVYVDVPDDFELDTDNIPEEIIDKGFEKVSNYTADWFLDENEPVTIITDPNS